MSLLEGPSSSDWLLPLRFPLLEERRRVWLLPLGFVFAFSFEFSFPVNLCCILDEEEYLGGEDEEEEGGCGPIMVSPEETVSIDPDGDSINSGGASSL
jgi:hypothetical protein